MTADPAILKRIRGCPFARGGRVLVRFRANGSPERRANRQSPLARQRTSTRPPRANGQPRMRLRMAGSAVMTSLLPELR